MIKELFKMAERQRFELWVLLAQRFSRPPLSTAQPPLRLKAGHRYNKLYNTKNGIPECARFLKDIIQTGGPEEF